MGGWCLHLAEHSDADQSHCADNESNGSIVLKPNTSRVRNRRPDPRLRGDTGEICLDILPYGRTFKRTFWSKGGVETTDNGRFCCIRRFWRLRKLCTHGG